MPYLVNGIHSWNQKHQRDPDVFKPNLKGWMVGNGVTNWLYDTEPAAVDMYYWHSLVSMDWYESYKANNCSMARFAEEPEPGSMCETLIETYENVTADVNMYDILGTCYGTDSGNETN